VEVARRLGCDVVLLETCFLAPNAIIDLFQWLQVPHQLKSCRS